MAHESSQPEPRAPASLFADSEEARPEATTRDEAADQAADRALEQRRMVRGLLLFGILVLLASIAHAGLSRAFYPGWLRQW